MDDTEKAIQEAANHLMKTPGMAAQSKEVQDVIREDLVTRARNITKFQGVAALAEFKKQYG